MRGRDERHAGKMEGMKGMESMPGMQMGSKNETPGAETRQTNGLTLLPHDSAGKSQGR